VSFADSTPANTLVTTDAGNVGIGTSSPGEKLHVVSTSNATGIRVSGSVDNVAVNLYNSGTGGRNWGMFSANNGSGAGGGALAFFDHTAGAYRAIIDSSGNLLVGTTSYVARSEARLTVVKKAGNANNPVANFKANATTLATTMLGFYDGTDAFCGQAYIDPNSNTTVFATSSDYRLKQNVVPMTGALERVSQLKPCTYTWKKSGSAGEGFIAHELAEVCPVAVIGEKDAVNEDGGINPQMIDTSFLVATLTAAIQEQQAIITALTARVEALEGAQA
jgi:hypothetical protein